MLLIYSTWIYCFGLALINTPLGWIQGFTHPYNTTNTRQFWNIPFAEVPTGDRRWKPPIPLTQLPSSPYPATNTTQKICIQNGGNDTWKGSEDCLYLTITIPSVNSTVPERGFPVYVYIYGGGFVSSGIMDASGWVGFTQSHIYVSITYRLGLLGFFPNVDLTEEDNRTHTSGNQGL